jgi:hypothetical protein
MSDENDRMGWFAAVCDAFGIDARGGPTWFAIPWRHTCESDCIVCAVVCWDGSPPNPECDLCGGAGITTRTQCFALPDAYCLQRTELWAARWGVNTRPEER